MPKKGGNCSKNELIRSAQAACACGWLKAAVFRGALASTVYFARSEAIKRGGSIAIDATGGWNTGWKVTHTQNSTTTDLQTMSAHSNLAVTQSNAKTKLFVDRWGMLSETDGGAPLAMSFLLKPSGKSDTDSSAIRLCITGGGRIAQKTKGVACP